MHHTSPRFWSCFDALSPEAQQTAEKNYALLKQDSHHSSLRFKKIGRYWSVRAGLNNRALGVEVTDGILWIWIGPHDEYERLIAAQ